MYPLVCRTNYKNMYDRSYSQRAECLSIGTYVSVFFSPATSNEKRTDLSMVQFRWRILTDRIDVVLLHDLLSLQYRGERDRNSAKEIPLLVLRSCTVPCRAPRATVPTTPFCRRCNLQRPLNAFMNEVGKLLGVQIDRMCAY